MLGAAMQVQYADRKIGFFAECLNGAYADGCLGSRKDQNYLGAFWFWRVETNLSEQRACYIIYSWGLRSRSSSSDSLRFCLPLFCHSLYWPETKMFSQSWLHERSNTIIQTFCHSISPGMVYVGQRASKIFLYFYSKVALRQIKANHFSPLAKLVIHFLCHDSFQNQRPICLLPMSIIPSLASLRASSNSAIRLSLRSPSAAKVSASATTSWRVFLVSPSLVAI